MATTYVTQEMPANIEEVKARAERQSTYNAKHVVFRAHLYKCKLGDQLPRGKFFKGKKPQVVIMDEAHMLFSNKGSVMEYEPYDGKIDWSQLGKLSTGTKSDFHNNVLLEHLTSNQK